MSKTTEALKLALETAEAIVAANWKTWEELATPEEFERWAKSRANHMVAAIREARAEQERQEPVAWPIDRNWFYSVLRYAENNPDYFDDVAPDCISLESNEADTVIDALNAASVSAKREWVDLTDDEIDESWCIEPKPINGLLVAEPVKQEPMAFADKYGNLYSVAGKLALELECLLLDTEDLSVVSKWWDSAHDALEQWRSIKDTAPVERQWVDLTDDELLAALVEIDASTVRLPIGFKLFARAVIAAFKEKNK